jgi:hypothetical protein
MSSTNRPLPAVAAVYDRRSSFLSTRSAVIDRRYKIRAERAPRSGGLQTAERIQKGGLESASP